MESSQTTTSALDIAIKYLEYLEEYGAPTTVSEFCHAIDLQEEDFYRHFDNIQQVKTEVWSLFFHSTFQILMEDNSYPEFSMKEKLLSFYYTQIQVLEENHTFVHMEKQSWLDPNPQVMSQYRKSFKEYVARLIEYGFEQNEIADRKYLSDVYVEGFWLQLLFVIRFWVQDQSRDKEATDAAIEKAVHLSFELITCGPLEAFFDFAKFIVQHKTKSF